MRNGKDSWSERKGFIKKHLFLKKMGLVITKKLKGQVYKTGYTTLKEKGLVIVWMSVGNSYFKKEIIQNLIEFSVDNFSQVKLLAPFEPAKHTYQALGYEERTARKKARLNSNRLKNHMFKAIEGLPEQKKKKIQIVDWDIDVANQKPYLKALKEIVKLYKENSSFNKDAKDTTSKVLKQKHKEVSEEAIDKGVEYLLEELAFIIASPELFNVKRTAYVYHRKWLIYEKLVNGRYDPKIRESLGFLLVR